MTRRLLSPPHGAQSERRRLQAAATVVALGALLAGCTGTPPVPVTPTQTATVAPTPTASVPAAPALVPDGTAEENLPFFRQVVEQVWSSPDQVSGRAYIDALVAAGFPKSAMQVTPDQTTIGNPAESIQFSVQWQQECLVGQVGPSIGSAVTLVAPVLPDGGCLLGATRPIDW